MKIKLSYCPAILLFVLLCSSCKKETMYEKIEKDAKIFTQKNCPKQMDDYTIMDSTTYDIPSNTFTYYYTVNDKLEDTSVYTEELKSSFRNTILKEIKGSIPMKGYKDAGITFVYQYRGKKTNKVLLKLKFTAEDYK